LFRRYARKSLTALACAAAFIAAGCHHNNLNSGYGIAWVTLSATPGDFTSYIVNVDSVALKGKTYGVVTPVTTVETVDFTKLKDIAELWSAASVPNDTYTSATIVLDYTSANISVMVNGAPQKATVVDTTGKAVTTQTINITFDPQHQPTIQPTLSSSSAIRLAINFDLAASNVINLGTTPATVTIKPMMTIATAPPDTKQVRIRGPLINSSVGVGTYTVYVRPFFDEYNSLGQLTLFNSASTVYQLNGVTYVGAPGITALSQTSAGTTITAAYTNFEPTPTLNAAVTAGKFNATYVVAGSTLEDFYTQGLEGDVIKRSGNTLTLRGATLQLNDGTSSYLDAAATPNDALLLVGPSTIVTAEDSTTMTNLNYNSISVGQHVIARGIYSLPASKVTTVDATGSSSTNTGSVRLQTTELFGTVVSSGAGAVVLDLANIGNWPVSIYDFAGNGAAGVTPTAYEINSGTLALPAGTATGGPLWVDGISAPFGSAPPDFLATSISAEATVPARLQVAWPAGTTTPFATLTPAGLTIDLANTHLGPAVIEIGAETLQLKSLAASPNIVPQAVPAGTSGLPPVFLPSFALGDLSAANTTTITVFNSFAPFVTQIPKSIVTATLALQFVAMGVYNRATNTFTASSIDVVN
jgi:sulfur transfer complex TusBCD TusB component (DsrH family)